MPAFPKFKKWQTELKIEDLRNGCYDALERFTVLFVSAEEDIVFPSIINYPHFMVTEEIFRIFKVFEPNLENSRIVLIERKQGRSETYFLPWLQNLEYSIDKESKKMLFAKKCDNHRKLVFSASHEKSRIQNTVIRLELLESLLRRSFVGIKAEEIRIKWKEE